MNDDLLPTAEKIAERLKYEAENGSVKFEKTETSLN